MRKLVSSSHFAWLSALTATLLFIGKNGYWFNFSDQEEHLPQVYKLYNHALYIHDYFMAANEQTFSIRFYYKWFVYLCSLPVGVPVACFILTIVTILISAWAVYKIAHYFSDECLTSFLAPVLLLVLLNGITLGDNSFQDSAVVCTSFSMMFGSLAFLQFFKGRYYFMALLAGLGGLFQVLDSLLMISILFPLMILYRNEKLINALKVVSVFILIVSPMLIPVIYRQFIADVNYDKMLYYKALFQLRNPNHYLPSHFPVKDYIYFGMLTISGFLAVLGNRPLKKFLFIVTGIILLDCLLYYILLEKFHFYVIGKTQWFKASVWLTLFYAISLSCLFSVYIKKYFKTQTLLLKYQSLIVVFCLFTLPVIFLSRFNPVRHFRLIYHVGYYEKSDLQKMHEWIEINTPIDAVFLTSPGDVSFLCEAKRSLLCGYKAVIHEPYFMIPWSQNFQRIFNFNVDSLKDESPWIASMNGYYSKYYYPLPDEKLDYRLDELSNCKFVGKLGPVIHREGDYVLTAILRNNK